MARGGKRQTLRELLLKSAEARSTVTYGQVMGVFGLSRGRALSHAIAHVDEKEYRSGAPGFAAIIVRKDTGFPGGGYFCDETLPLDLRRPAARSSDPKLSQKEREHVLLQQERIWSFYENLTRMHRSAPSTRLQGPSTR